jgi:para-aminobenzoate synthetase/4-amino-4-deoxychorismate lyase
MREQEACFALLDDSKASPDDRRSRLYTGYVRTLVCERAKDIPALFAALDAAFDEGLHAVALFSYETGAEMQEIAPHDRPSRMPSQLLLFRHMQRSSSAQVAEWLAAKVDESPACSQQISDGRHVSGIAAVHADTDAAAFDAAVERIGRYIEAGDTYQVNFTFRMQFAAYGSAPALYQRLRERQPVPYGALIALPDGRAVLSLSPELFVRHHQGVLTAQPMKGTAAATTSDADNAVMASALAADEKNRAENVMIVDLLRNDLGRVAVNGSVHVPALFEVTRYSTVLQMTSTIEARLRDGVMLPDLMAALYPCGSITGAPKRRTMQIVREIETTPRGWYTGAIGWFDPPESPLRPGDFCLSVPIRTLVLDPPADDGLRRGEMGVGSGIVYDSAASDEYAECLLKTRFLTGLRPQFDLFETMRVTREGGCHLLSQHLARLRGSAAFFGFPWDEAALARSLQHALQALGDSGSGIWRLRLSIDPSGQYHAETTPMTLLETPVKVLIAPKRTSSGDPFLRHKTTIRNHYDAAWRSAERQGAFDMLFINQNGKVTEGGRSNVFVKRNGRWMTPPLEAGVLPGVMRGDLLKDPIWNAVEAPLSVEDLRDAEEIVVCNALRGVLPAVINWQGNRPG